MKITVISDTHTLHKQVTTDLIGGDVLIHAGDFMSSGYSESEAWDFMEWLNAQDYKHKIFIAGNHDRLFEIWDVENAIESHFPDLIYLQDTSVTIDGIKFYGSPWTPEFMGWAFALPLCDIVKTQHTWSKIPNNTDVLITHGPSHMKRDYINGNNVGCHELSKRIEEVQPQYHVFGHIHEGYGGMIAENDKTVYLNASVLNNRYNYTNKPIDFEIDNDT